MDADSHFTCFKTQRQGIADLGADGLWPERIVAKLIKWMLSSSSAAVVEVPLSRALAPPSTVPRRPAAAAAAADVCM